MRQAFAGGTERKCHGRRGHDGDICCGQDRDRQARRWAGRPALGGGVTPRARAVPGHIQRDRLDDASHADKRQQGEQDDRQGF